MGAIVETARQAIARVEALGAAGKMIFTEFDPARILAQAAAVEEQAAAGEMPLAGRLVSVKDLYDEAGQRTTAGSRLLAERPAAETDSVVVARMKAAGAIMFGRTTMSEFAYSGVGLNPHFGTPGSVFDAKEIPGGSTSGGALTVALGICDIALGTDTGGSVRIPSAINGLYGFKPTAASVSLEGVHPLSKSFDSAGPLCRDLETAIAAYEVMSGSVRAGAAPGGPLELAVPAGAFVTDLDSVMEEAQARAVTALRDAGHRVRDIDLTFLPEQMGHVRVIVAHEALALYRDDLDRLETVGDPRVLRRIRFALDLDASTVEAAYAARREAVARFSEALDGVEAIVTPTLQRQPPSIAETEADFDRMNAAMLRNPSMINFTDGCAVSLPVPQPGSSRPIGIMLSAPGGRDARLLGVARALDPGLRG